MQTQQQRSMADASTSHAEFKSPFHRGTSNQQDTTVIPSFKNYRSGAGEQSNKMFQYFMVGAFGGISALGAKNTVQGKSEICSEEADMVYTGQWLIHCGLQTSS